MTELSYICPAGHQRTLEVETRADTSGDGRQTQLEVPCVECGRVATLVDDPSGTETKNFYKKVVYVVALLAPGGIFMSHSNINAGLVATALTWIACIAALYFLNR